jgi:hypothetical protein
LFVKLLLITWWLLEVAVALDLEIPEQLVIQRRVLEVAVDTVNLQANRYR